MERYKDAGHLIIILHQKFTLLCQSTSSNSKEVENKHFSILLSLPALYRKASSQMTYRWRRILPRYKNHHRLTRVIS
jgi:hypothetical protein